MSDIVTLTVNGFDYSGWKSIRIEAGIERMARSFELSVTDLWPGVSHIRRIQPGDLCEVAIGSELVCTGYVDATPVNYDGSGITIMIRGRSKTADLIDSSADNKTGQFKGQKVEVIAAKMAAQYGINVVVETDTGDAVTDHQIQQGETVFESLDRLAKSRQILITDNAAGDVVLVSPGSGGESFSGLALGDNVLSASAGFDFTEVYSQYTVKGQKSGTDDSYGANAAQSTGTALDSNIKRRRVLIVRQDGQADNSTCKQRADYEQQIRIAKAGEIRYRVAGWRQANGALWTINRSVFIDDGIMEFTGNLLISEVMYTLDDSGMITELVTIPPEAFATAPEKAAKAEKRKTTKGGKNTSWLD